MSTEIPTYRVAQREGDIEIREYPALVAAEVSVGGERDTAVREGFRLLAGYIFGGNDGGRRIAMTAPVMQQPQPGTRIAMTAPGALPRLSDARAASTPLHSSRAQ